MPTLREDVAFYAASLRSRPRTPWESGLLELLEAVDDALATHLVLSPRDAAAFVHALDAPPAPNARLRTLMRGGTNEADEDPSAGV